jgi:hypothetical protein
MTPNTTVKAAPFGRWTSLMKALITTIAISGLCHAVYAAPDEDKLGKGQSYPIGTAKTWFLTNLSE